jgi:molybdenum transport protein
VIRFTENEIEQLILDDAPLGDLTTYLLGLGSQKGKLEILAREDLMVSGTEESVRLFKKLDLTVKKYLKSGTLCNAGDSILTVTGDAGAIHSAWRASGTIIEFSSGIASRTHKLVTAARKGNSLTTVAGSRKHAPFLKKIALKSLMAGGAVPHRTGLSDTILIFKEHLLFTGGYEKLSDTVKAVRQQQKERIIVVEAHSQSEIMAVARSTADFVQIDKMPLPEFTSCVKQCLQLNPHMGIIAAGGINADNATAYAKAGAHVLVTSWMYAAPPADIKVKITPYN